jgi:hypothetical protein
MPTQKSSLYVVILFNVAAASPFTIIFESSPINVKIANKNIIINEYPAILPEF